MAAVQATFRRGRPRLLWVIPSPNLERNNATANQRQKWKRSRTFHGHALSWIGAVTRGAFTWRAVAAPHGAYQPHASWIFQVLIAVEFTQRRLALGKSNSHVAGVRRAGAAPARHVKCALVTAPIHDRHAHETCNSSSISGVGFTVHCCPFREGLGLGIAQRRRGQPGRRRLDAHRRGLGAVDDAGPVVFLRRHGQLQERRLDDACRAWSRWGSSASSGSSSASAWHLATTSGWGLIGNPMTFFMFDGVGEATHRQAVGDGPLAGLRHVSAQVRHHHAGPDHRFVRRAGAVFGLSALHGAVQPVHLLRRWRTGPGIRTESSSNGA